MSNDKIKANTTIEADQSAALNTPSPAEPNPELAQLDEIYGNIVKNKLESLRKTQFIGTSEGGSGVEESEAACTVKMTSQHAAVEVNINPGALLKALNEAQINTKNIEIDQLIHVCVTLGEFIRLAFNHATEKAHKSSEVVFNSLMEEMQNELLDTKK